MIAEGAQPAIKTSLLDSSSDDITSALKALGQPSYRRKQILKWIYREGVFDFALMTDLPVSLRSALADTFEVLPLEETRTIYSSDGWTKKSLFRIHASAPGIVSPRVIDPSRQTIESVLMRYDPTDSQKGRNSVCVSSQAGCAVGCPFCATGQAGFFRNLTTGEIVGQILAFDAQLRPNGENVSNVVLMGQGEPMLNLERVWKAVEIINDPDGLGIGARHITMSTSGIIPGILNMIHRQPPIRLAVSLHSVDNALRDRLVPINRRYPVQDLIAACHEYSSKTGRRVTFEYALMGGVNDSISMARDMGRLLARMNSHVNLIPINPTPGSDFHRPTDLRIRDFQGVLQDSGVQTTVRIERGIDIFAGCGQLRADEAANGAKS